MRRLYDELVMDANSERWNEFDLPKLSLLQMQTTARLLGCPFTGTKSSLVVRLLSVRLIRIKLSRFALEPAAVAEAFQKRELQAMCKQAGLWRSGNKRQLGATLLSWRERCRKEGKKVLDEVLERTRLENHQMELKL